ncbi:MAG: nucleoside triphosphate pyrophosphohydrolase [Gemmatimonadetes bacterium]|nr:nucleoside triphosphate pyrophosphohydrolase [Gemmatimonadota bacterium]
MSNHTFFNQLVKLMKQLRSEDGCPWDIEQTHHSLRPYLMEECYETLEAIDSKNYKELVNELGDVLLQVVFHSQIAAENNKFDIEDVCKSIVEKLIRRHPHVFGNTPVEGKQQVIENWDAIKREEKKQEGHDKLSLLDGIPKNMPALMRSHRLQQRASKEGFDWTNLDDPLEKLNEECNELIESCRNKSIEHMEDELGDVLFSIVNIARFLEIDAEQSLRMSANKFERRFRAIEQKLREQKLEMENLDLQSLDEMWNEVKREEQP